MEDRRAHDRIEKLETVVQTHLIEHSRFEADLQKNTKLTQEIADNTSDIVALLKGVKGLRSFVVWGAPVVLAFAAIISFIRGWK